MELVSDAECVHGLTVRTCDFCLGALRRRDYRRALIQVMPGILPSLPERKNVIRCERCPKRGASKGNRITVKLPRPPRGAFGRDVPSYPPTFCGPTIEAPRVHKATHKTRNGQWVCDSCDPTWAKQRPPRAAKPTRSREVLSRQEVIE